VNLGLGHLVVKVLRLLLVVMQHRRRRLQVEWRRNQAVCRCHGCLSVGRGGSTSNRHRARCHLRRHGRRLRVLRWLLLLLLLLRRLLLDLGLLLQHLRLHLGPRHLRSGESASVAALPAALGRILDLGVRVTLWLVSDLHVSEQAPRPVGPGSRWLLLLPCTRAGTR
jgi:hypothetical protein